MPNLKAIGKLVLGEKTADNSLLAKIEQLQAIPGKLLASNG